MGSLVHDLFLNHTSVESWLISFMVCVTCWDLETPFPCHSVSEFQGSMVLVVEMYGSPLSLGSTIVPRAFPNTVSNISKYFINRYLSREKHELHLLVLALQFIIYLCVCVVHVLKFKNSKDFDNPSDNNIKYYLTTRRWNQVLQLGLDPIMQKSCNWTRFLLVSMQPRILTNHWWSCRPVKGEAEC